MYKQGIPQGGAMSQRGPSPLPTPPISPGHNMAGSMVQARIQANNPTGMFSGEVINLLAYCNKLFQG